jgi:hypothetical protein
MKHVGPSRVSLAVCTLGLALAGCAGASVEASTPAPVDLGSVESVDVVVTSVPASAGNALGTPLDRSKVRPGLFTTHVAIQSHHGCSMSWSSLSVTGTVTFEVQGKTASLAVDLDEHSVSGSRSAGATVNQHSESVDIRLSGPVESTEPGTFIATLSDPDCAAEEAGRTRYCAKPIAVKCKEAAITVGGEDSREPTSTLTGLSCEGIPGIESWGHAIDTIAFSAGTPLELKADGYGPPRFVRHAA